MIVFQTFNIRIYPNQIQKEAIKRNLGTTRFLHNYILNEIFEKYNKTKQTIYYKEINEIITRLKNYEAIFINELEDATIDKIIQNLLRTFKKYTQGKINKPKYKSKTQSRQTYFVKNYEESIKLNNDKIYIKHLGVIRFAKSAIPQGKVFNVTIIRETDDKYYLSIVAHEYKVNLPHNNNHIGIDLGITSLVTLSNGEKYTIKDDEMKNLEIKIAKENKILSRKIESAKKKNINLDYAMNFQKQKRKIYNLHIKISNLRQNDLHQLSTMLISKYQVICIEDLDVEDLISKKRISKHIQRVSWSTFVRMLEYKAKWYGREIIKIGRWYPSTTTCSNCNKQTGPKSLNTRTWICLNCKKVHDRDINASMNILKEGIRIRNT